MPTKVEVAVGVIAVPDEFVFPEDARDLSPRGARPVGGVYEVVPVGERVVSPYRPRLRPLAARGSPGRHTQSDSGGRSLFQ